MIPKDLALPENARSARALIAMSGGVDSSVAAHLVREAGLDPIGCTMRLFDNEAAGIESESGCCALSDVEDARQVAQKIGIPFYVFNYQDAFHTQVIDRFAQSYCCGKTPNPCIACNKYLKFGALLQRAFELGCEYVATGHYARIDRDPESGEFLLKKALDPQKDQSYVLYDLTQETLAHVLFPLGGMKKEEVRALARECGFINAKKRESQDICFAPDGDYAAAIRRHLATLKPDQRNALSAQAFTPGDFVDADGRVLGCHRGLAHYTVGQRKGLGISSPYPLYVQRLDAQKNTVVLGKDEDLYAKEVFVQNVNWIAQYPPEAPVRCKAKIRYRHTEQPCTVVRNDTRAQIVFDEPQRAPTPGQSAVFYDGEIVLGGGIIE